MGLDNGCLDQLPSKQEDKSADEYQGNVDPGIGPEAILPPS